nr:hypothetical protein JVH1_0813 [Rhodococcus sp. JVH1]
MNVGGAAVAPALLQRPPPTLHPSPPFGISTAAQNAITNARSLLRR